MRDDMSNPLNETDKVTHNPKTVYEWYDNYFIEEAKKDHPLMYFVNCWEMALKTVKNNS